MANEIEIIWTLPAKNDLRDIFDYINQFDEKAAFKIVNRILDKTEHLRDGFLDMGQEEPLLKHKPDVYRYLVEGNYKIIYKVKEGMVIIDAVFDARRNPRELDKIIS